MMSSVPALEALAWEILGCSPAADPPSMPSGAREDPLFDEKQAPIQTDFNRGRVVTTS